MGLTCNQRQLWRRGWGEVFARSPSPPLLGPPGWSKQMSPGKPLENTSGIRHMGKRSSSSTTTMIKALNKHIMLTGLLEFLKCPRTRDMLCTSVTTIWNWKKSFLKLSIASLVNEYRQQHLYVQPLVILPCRSLQHLRWFESDLLAKTLLS